MPFNKAQIISYWFSSVSFYGLHGQTNRKPQQHPVVLLAVAILVLLMKVKLYLKKNKTVYWLTAHNFLILLLGNEKLKMTHETY